MQEKELISIGKISKPIGLKGYVKVLSLTDFPDRFKKSEVVKIFNEKGKSIIRNEFSNSEDFVIREVLFDKGCVKVLFEGYEEINLTRNLIGCMIVIEESERKVLGSGRYYLYDLIGLDVMNKGEKIGVTVSIENYGGQDLFNVRLTDIKKDVLIPFVEDFIKQIDVDKKYIEIEVIDGMLN